MERQAQQWLWLRGDLLVSFPGKGKEPVSSWKEKFTEFLDQDEIIVTKKTKRSEKTVDIRPFIYKAEIQEKMEIHAAGFCKLKLYKTGTDYGYLYEMDGRRAAGVCISY